MKNIKSILLYIFFLLLTHFAQGQVKIKWQDVKVINDQTIVVKVFAQNYGRGFEFWNQYGYYGNKENANFYVEYDLLRGNRRIKILPSSITIETIFGTSVEMDTPLYYFGSTGSERGELWEIIFEIPRESVSIVLNVMGKRKTIDDFEQGRVLKQKLTAEFLTNKDSKVFDYKLFNTKEYSGLEEEIKKIVFLFGEKRKKGIISGTIIYSIKKDGTTTFTSKINNPELNELILNSVGNYNLKQAVQYGYAVNAEAKYDIFLAKGKVRTKLNKEKKIINIKPSITNVHLLKEIEEEINGEGTFKVKYDIMTVNGVSHPYSRFNYKLAKFNYAYLYWGVPVIIGLIVGVSGGGS